MARTETTANLITRATERADMENSNFISSAEKYRLLNTWTAKLWSKLVKIDPDRYTAEQTFTGDGSTQDFSVSSDYYGTIGVDYVSDSTQGIYVPLPRLFGSDESRIAQSTPSEPVGYTFRYNTSTPSTQLVRVLPTMDSSSTCRHRYIVAPPKYATDGTDSAETVIGVAGFEEYIVIGMAIDMRIKEESSVVQLRQSLAEMEMHLEEMAENRAADSAGHVHDSRGSEYYFNWADAADWPRFGGA
jgi:hypothetical protein